MGKFLAKYSVQVQIKQKQYWKMLQWCSNVCFSDDCAKLDFIHLRYRIEIIDVIAFYGNRVRVTVGFSVWIMVRLRVGFRDWIRVRYRVWSMVDVRDSVCIYNMEQFLHLRTTSITTRMLSRMD